MSDMPSHPYAELFPMMDEESFERLKADIDANGLHEKIVRYQDKILDGRNRHKACVQTMTKPEFTDFQGDDEAALAFVVRKNLNRRHLTESQRALVASKLANRNQGGNQNFDGGKENRQAGGLLSDESKPTKETVCPSSDDSGSGENGKTKTAEPAITNKEAAERMRVSTRSVERANRVLKNAPADIVAAVESGKMSLNEAEKLLKKKNKKKQTRRADPLNDANGKPIPERLRDLFGDPWLHKYLAQVDEWLIEMGNQKWITQLKGKSQPYGAFLRAGDGLKHLAEALKGLELLRETIAAGVPHTVCRSCEGAKGGCEDCRKTGWLPEWREKELHG